MREGPAPLDRTVCLWVHLKACGVFLLFAQIVQLLIVRDRLSFDIMIVVFATLPIFVATAVLYMALFDQFNRWYIGYAIILPIGWALLLYGMFVAMLQLLISFVLQLPMNFVIPMSIPAFVAFPLSFIFFLRKEQRILARDREELQSSLSKS